MKDITMEMVKDAEVGDYVGDKNMQKKRARFKEILTEHAMMATVHGVAHIIVAKQTYKKILWITLWLLTVGALCYQIFKLSSLFLSRPKQTSLDLKFGALHFPAVSFCNINPLKKMQLDELSIPLKFFMTLSEVELKEKSKRDQPIIMDKNNPEFPFLRKFEKYGIAKEEWDLAKNIPDNHFQVRNMLVSDLIQKMDASELLRVGHSLDDMLLHCSFNSRRCNSSDFAHFKSGRFGNCYTLQSDRFVSTVPGPSHGLTLMLNLDSHEYVSPYSSGHGLKLVVHEPGTYPFIEEQGVTLAPDWTFISLKQKKINRLGHPHGNCEKHLEYKSKYGITYTRMACEQICLITLTEDICDCTTGFVSIDKSIVTNSTSTCSSVNEVCSLLVLKAQLKGDLHCPCTNPCSETHFSTTVSSLRWPHEEYMTNELVNLMCQEEIQAMKIKNVTGHDCIEIMNGTTNGSINTERLVDNFLKLDLYFEELSYEHVGEVPAYDSVQFLSDIGGTVGLFVGASVLSGVELIQILVDCIRYFMFRIMNK
ncbi:degenerin-like protein unc-105 isoform X2 [Mizuhopecten yessoensis]|nr:degenerin-like protein unc-105 isoform X2 [Mizuhopecten yessoensis]